MAATERSALCDIYRERFNYTDDQWVAFKSLCAAMKLADDDDDDDVFEREFNSELEALEALNEILQRRVYRFGSENPFGAARERFGIPVGIYTDKHRVVADNLKIIGSHRERAPMGSIGAVDVVFILGTTVPCMDRQIKFTHDRVLPNIEGPKPIIMGLTGNRKLTPAKDDKAQALLGDLSDEPRGVRYITTAEVARFSPEYRLDGEPTEAGAMDLLAREILDEKARRRWHLVDAIGKLTHDADGREVRKRPDTEDTGYYAGLAFRNKFIPVHKDFRLAIVSDAIFPGQKEQILAGLCRAGIRLRADQVVFYGPGYPDEALDRSPAYVQIAASSCAEQVYNLRQRYIAEQKHDAAVSGNHGVHPVAQCFFEGLEGSTNYALTQAMFR